MNQYFYREVLLITLFLIFSLRLSAQQHTIHLLLTPSLATEVLNKNGSFVKDFLEKETGLSIEMKIPASYDNMVEAFGAPTSCFAIMNSQSYVVANKKYGAVVKLRTIRFSHSVYYGMIITHASSGIKTLKDLNGKSVAYTDVLSTSGYLYPKKLMEKNNIKPSKEVFANKHDEVVEMVYERKVDAGAAFYSPPSNDGTIRDARSRLKAKYPDIESKVVIVTKTEPIPNDPIVFSKNFNPDTARKLYTALVKLSQDPKGKQALLDMYGTEGFVKASDTDYNSLRQIMGY